ncbi:MAG: zinc dependent phospholipase C family protein [Candidatus Bathyarchaeia archaeon]
MQKRYLKLLLITSFLSVLVNVHLKNTTAHCWSNGGYSATPEHPDYGTHDWIAQHVLDWLPNEEKQYILDNLATYLYGTELPDNGNAPDGIGDTTTHHVYYWANRSMQDDAAAVRAQTEYNNAVNYMRTGNIAMAVKTLGIMSHYIVDVGVFGHVMGSGTDWGSETHHSDYETYVNERTNAYNDEFNAFLSFDGALESISAYNATLTLAHDTTFDANGNLTCVWMDQNYNWNNLTFRNRCGESLNLAVNLIADVLHTFYASEIVSEFSPHTITVIFVFTTTAVIALCIKRKKIC